MQRIKSFIYIHRVWIFPILITLGLVCATGAKISGSSAGIYDMLSGRSSSGVITGEPRGVRSDEWLVNTPLTLSQVANNFPAYNSDVTGGHDMSVVVDVPYADWSVLFRPQNLSFFVLQVEHAFALKWWLLAWLLLIAVYVFVLYLLPGRHLIAALMAVAFLLNPFIQWWYQSITILPIAYALLLLVLALRSMETKSRKAVMLYGLGIAYLTSCFALIMYPAFQISIILVAVAIFVSIVTAKIVSKKFSYHLLLRPLIAAVCGLIPVLLFLKQHASTISVIGDTVYPGARNILAGGYDGFQFFIWPLSYLLPTSGPLTVFGDNQSEVSRFLTFGFLLVPVLLTKFILLRRDKKYILQTCLLIGTLVVSLLFLCHLFIPIGDPVYKLLGLHLIPHVRLQIAFGMINLIFLVLALSLPSIKYKAKRDVLDKWSVLQFGIGFIFVFVSTLIVKNHFQIPTVGLLEIFVLSCGIALTTALIAHHLLLARYIGLGMIIIFSFLCAYNVNPLYQGLGSLLDAQTAKSIQAKGSDDVRWIALRQTSAEGLPIANGAASLSGVSTYPNMSFWEKNFPGESSITNRYAHIQYDIDDALSSRYVSLPQADVVIVHASSCDSFFRAERIKYVIAPSNDTSTYECLRKTQLSDDPKLDIYTFTDR